MSDTVRISSRLCPLCGFNGDGSQSVCPNDGTPLKQSAVHNLVGQVIDGKYKVLSLLGSGGMGSVYKAHHMMLDCTVAVKILHPQGGSGEGERIKRFNQEGKLISALKHPNIVSALDFGVAQGAITYLVMDYIEGRSLHQVLQAEKRLAPDRAIDIFSQVCDALGFAHSKGVIHRDLKPSNIMLTDSGDGREMVKLLDFGVAKLLNANDSTEHLTKTGFVFGSPPYMSPEQCLGQPPSPQSDIYSLGCVMYETLTGISPIGGENSLEILHRQISLHPLAFAELPVQLKVPHGLEEIILKALQKKPEDRYASMELVRDELIKVRNNRARLRFTPHIRPPKQAAQTDGAKLKYALPIAGGALALIAAAAFVLPKLSPAVTPGSNTTHATTVQSPTSTDDFLAGQAAFDAGKYEDAVKHFSAALAQAEKSEGKRSPVLLAILKPLGESYDQLGKEKEYHDTFKAAVTLAKGTQEMPALRTLESEHIQHLLDRHQFDDAITESKEAFEQLKVHRSLTQADFAPLLGLMAVAFEHDRSDPGGQKFFRSEFQAATRDGDTRLIEALRPYTSIDNKPAQTKPVSTPHATAKEPEIEQRAPAKPPLAVERVQERLSQAHERLEQARGRIAQAATKVPPPPVLLNPAKQQTKASPATPGATAKAAFEFKKAADELIRRKQFADAELNIIQALTIDKQINDHGSYARDLVTLATIELLQDHPLKADIHARQARGVIEQLPNATSRQLSDALNRLGATYNAKHRPRIALQAYKFSANLRQRSGDTTSLTYGFALYGLGESYRAMKDYASAARAYQESLQPLRAGNPGAADTAQQHVDDCMEHLRNRG